LALTSATPRIDQATPQRLEAAVFGMGSFLRTEARFGIVRGVWKTTVGYGGGKSACPSCGDAGDHVEVVRVEYDPVTVSYGQLLELFLSWNSSSENPCFPQYASCIFVKNEFEKRMAQAALERYRLCSDGPADIRIATYKTFHMAPNRFQKYFLRTLLWLMKEVRHFYRDEIGFVRSTLSMRLNGIVGQLLPFTRLPEDITLYDLDEDVVCTLEKYIAS
jgi:peptide-methionine (S)-S-oxide reductase